MRPPHAVRGEPPPRRMASCVDVPRWANFRGHTCADYLAFNWCAGGRVLNASASGAIFGRPEWACCTCGAASAADVRAAGAVTNLFFIATHEVDDVDELGVTLSRADTQPPPESDEPMRPKILATWSGWPVRNSRIVCSALSSAAAAAADARTMEQSPQTRTSREMPNFGIAQRSREHDEHSTRPQWRQWWRRCVTLPNVAAHVWHALVYTGFAVLVLLLALLRYLLQAHLAPCATAD